jgi:histidyl-tRNA synthetase
MTIINTKALSGFMELRPNEQISFNKMLNTIEESYKLFGFRPIETPVLEREEVLLAKGGGETEKQIYTLSKGNTNMAMRFDLTVPLARYVANNENTLTFPFKRYAIGKVYRGERPQAGRFREFYQCDIDIINKDNLDILYDAEIPAVIANTFQQLGFEKFTIKINNRKILTGLLEEYSLNNKYSDILRIMDKMGKLPQKAIEEEFLKIGLTKQNIEDIKEISEISKLDEKDLFKKLRNIQNKSTTLSTGISELEKVIEQIKNLGVKTDNFKIDLTLARGLDYYTGTIYETILNDYPEIGSVCGGGRYDNLAGYYTKNKYPGVGISIGLTRLFDQLYSRELVDTSTETPTQVLIISFLDDDTYSLNLLKYLRDNNICSEILSKKTSVKKQLTYASKLNIPYVIFIGEEEIANQEFSLREMKEGKQSKMNREDILEYIQGNK